MDETVIMKKKLKIHERKKRKNQCRRRKKKMKKTNDSSSNKSNLSFEGEKDSTYQFKFPFENQIIIPHLIDPKNKNIRQISREFMIILILKIKIRNIFQNATKK